MTNFINLIQNESISTIEGLTGQKPNIKYSNIMQASHLNIDGPFAFVELKNNNNINFILLNKKRQSKKFHVIFLEHYLLL